ncbi:KRAB-A domain-containing 2-like [Brachionus plicatilis]|uniref:KRAB-A domain-containing 2-like n=1 Tax=Brachionus plicatilis TaxID=10195 RepID=A0A3M7ST54_BRAPC|nr:KRAB-A domain-containing 2-like [Brachionus plicatilis]
MIVSIEEALASTTIPQLFETVGYEGPEADLCLNLPEKDNVDLPEDVFNPADFELGELVTPPPPQDEQPIAEIMRKADTLLGIRNTVFKQRRTRSKRYVPEVSTGDYVALPIPDVDRGLCEARNLICRIVDIDYDKSLYELACEAAVLDTMFARNSFDLVKDCSVEVEVRLDKKLSVRQAVKEQSIGGGQGILKCNCTEGCLTNRCSCKKAGLLCNSRCHGANDSCKNK